MIFASIFEVWPHLRARVALGLLTQAQVEIEMSQIKSGTADKFFTGPTQHNLVLLLKTWAVLENGTTSAHVSHLGCVCVGGEGANCHVLFNSRDCLD